MLNLFHTQNGYAKNTCEYQTLAIAVRNDGFSFVIRTQNAVAALRYTSIFAINNAEYEQALREFLRHDLLQQSFAKISVLYCNQAVSVVPKEFYSPENAQEIFTLTQPCAENETVESYHCKNSDTIILYTLPHNIVRICNEELKAQCRFFPQIVPFIEKSFAGNSAANVKTLYISLESYYFDVVVVNDGKLEFFNNFSFKNVNDFVYSTLNVCKQLQLNPQTTNIVLSGKISEKSNYCKALQMFAPHAHVENPENCACEFPFNPILYSVFSNLISTDLCE